MRVIVELTKADLTEMDVTEDQLEESTRNAMGCLDVEGDRLYINDLEVVVVVTD